MQKTRKWWLNNNMSKHFDFYCIKPRICTCIKPRTCMLCDQGSNYLGLEQTNGLSLLLSIYVHVHQNQKFKFTSKYLYTGLIFEISIQPINGSYMANSVNERGFPRACRDLIPPNKGALTQITFWEDNLIMFATTYPPTLWTEIYTAPFPHCTHTHMGGGCTSGWGLK